MDSGTFESLTAADYAEPEAEPCLSCALRQRVIGRFAMCDAHAMQAAAAVVKAEMQWYKRTGVQGWPNSVHAFGRLAAHFAFAVLGGAQ